MNLLTEHILVAGAVLFATGMLGLLTRRSLILMFLSLELMLAGVSVNLVAFSRHHDNYQGQVFAILILTVAACEAALAMAIIVALYRQRPTLEPGDHCMNVRPSIAQTSPTPRRRTTRQSIHRCDSCRPARTLSSNQCPNDSPIQPRGRT